MQSKLEIYTGTGNKNENQNPKWKSKSKMKNENQKTENKFENRTWLLIIKWYNVYCKIQHGFINMYFYIHNDAVYEYVVSKLLKINNAMTVCRLFNSLNKLEQKYRVI